MADNVFTNLIFVSDGGGSTPSEVAGTICNSMIGFRNSLLTATVSGADADASYPFSNCLDYKDNTQYSPSATSGTVTIEFTQSSDIEIDYIGIAIHNGSTASLVGRLDVFVNGTWETVASFTPLGDLRTICEKFDTVTCSKQRLVLTFESKLYIGTVYIGKSWEFARLPNVGFVPGNTNNIDRVVNFKSNQSGQFIIGRRQQVGYAQSGEFDFLSFDGDIANYTDYMHHVKDSKPFFMKWNVNVAQSMFGQHANPNNLRPPTYTTNNNWTFSFDMEGYN